MLFHISAVWKVFRPLTQAYAKINTFLHFFHLSIYNNYHIMMTQVRFIFTVNYSLLGWDCCITKCEKKEKGEELWLWMFSDCTYMTHVIQAQDHITEAAFVWTVPQVLVLMWKTTRGWLYSFVCVFFSRHYRHTTFSSLMFILCIATFFKPLFTYSKKIHIFTVKDYSWRRVKGIISNEIKTVNKMLSFETISTG